LIQGIISKKYLIMQQIGNLKYSFLNFCNLEKEQINLIFQERNKDAVRKWMFDSKLIKLEEHYNFIASLKDSISKIYLLVVRNKIPIGVYNLVEISEGKAQGGFYLFESSKEKNLGLEFLYYCLKYVFENLNINEIYGYSLKANRNANSINKYLGFEFNETNNELVYSFLRKDKFVTDVIENPKILNLLKYTLINH